ncbi:hypothetical protein [Streptococcus parasuis]|uniref:hypothetical protein n=1 Tax=Streptococcus parasuis TaxID=1501662 RepID=UPI00289DA43D|nr:hypothetical protein [Streptococcus parasuis]
MTDIGKQLVQNLVSLIDLVFNFTVTNEIIIFLYKVLVIIFLILTCIIVTVYLWKKFYPKTDYQVDPEFERIIKNNNLNNIWVLGPWGSGKTKFVKSSLNSLGQKFFYVSLFGLNSRNEVIQEINEQIVNETKLSLLVDLPVIGILFKWLFQINGLSILKNHRKHIIVIDDFERVSNDFLTSNKIQNRHSGNVENNTDLAIYNDVLGVIDYIQQTIGCKVVVISSEENLEKLFTEIIIPKFHPYQYHIKFDVAMINDFPKLFFKKNNPKEVEDFSFIFSSIWNERIKATSLTNYRPIIHELSFLSDESDVRFQISYVLSRLMDCWAVQMPVGSLIPFQFLLDRIKNNRSDTRRYNLIKKIIKEYKFNDGFPYYIKVNSKERIAARFEAKEVLVRNYMGINLGSMKISEDYEFDDDEILLLTSQNPDSQLQTKKIKDWVSENYIKFKYRNPTMTYKNILVPKSQRVKWKKIYQNELANYFVKDEKIDFDPELTNSIINTINKFEFLTSDIEKFLNLVDLDYVIEFLLEADHDENLIASRILYKFLSSFYPVSGNISLYLIAEYMAVKLDSKLEITADDYMFPVISNGYNSTSDFVNSQQYKFDELLLNLSENTIDNIKVKDEKVLEVGKYAIYKEHALFIVKNMEITDTINGIPAQEHIANYLDNNNDDLKTIVDHLERYYAASEEKNNRVNDYRIEQEYDEYGEILDEYPVYYEPLKERYNRWWKFIDER